MPTTKTAAPTRLRNWIAGAWQADAPALQPVVNPADRRELIAELPLSTAGQMRAALDIAAASYRLWRRLSPSRRAEFIEPAIGEIVRRREDLARILTQENGKTLPEARAEVDSGIAEARMHLANGLSLSGQWLPARRPNTQLATVYSPLGVVGVITPWNFPFNTLCRKVIPALICGNTVVIKPSEFGSKIAHAFCQALATANLPEGVVNLVLGSGSALGPTLFSHPALRAVTFTGSTEVGMQLLAMAAPRNVRCQLEMGGKNASIVLADADFDAAVRDCALAAFACAGQWCTATSRILVEQSIYESFLAALTERANALRMGRGELESTQLGPVCGAPQQEKITEYLRLASHESLRRCCGGEPATDGDLQHGFFIKPTVFADVDTASRLWREEIFGPVVCVRPVSNLAEAIELANASDYGLASSLFTRDLAAALTYLNDLDAGVLHVNVPSGYKEAPLPFGGVKFSGHGPPENGRMGTEFFTDVKAAYIQI